jgi:hypothetical protein
MSLLSRVKKLFAFVALVLTLVLSGAFLPPSKVASTASCAQYETLTHYYSDATYTTRIGVCHTRCNLTSGGCTGSFSPYYIVENVDMCCDCVVC